MIDRRKGARYQRTALAERVFAGYAGLALLSLAAAFLLAPSPFWLPLALGAPIGLVALVFAAYAAAALALTAAASTLAPLPFWLPLAVAAPAGLIALAFDARGRSREALPEAAGAVALGASAPAIALAGGAAAAFAWGAGALLALRAVTSVLYVRARIRLDRGLAAGPRAVHAGHAVALVAATGLASVGWAPWLAPVVFFVLLARSGWGLSRWRRPVRPRTLGFLELGYGLLTLALLIVGYRTGR
jgi:hypothetical protein